MLIVLALRRAVLAASAIAEVGTRRRLFGGAFLLGSGLTELRIVVLALTNTIQELGPEAAALYAKHYEAQSLGPLRPVDAVRHASISQLIERLNGS
jgi:hypothetical protein